MTYTRGVIHVTYSRIYLLNSISLFWWCVCWRLSLPQCIFGVIIVGLQYSWDLVLFTMLFFYLLAVICASFPFYSLSVLPKSHFCSPPASFLFSWAGFSSSIFHLICKAAEFLSCLTLLPASTCPSAISSLIRGRLLLRNSTLHLCVSGHFNYRRDSLSSFADRRYLPLSVPPVALISKFPAWTVLSRCSHAQ